MIASPPRDLARAGVGRPSAGREASGGALGALRLSAVHAPATIPGHGGLVGISGSFAHGIHGLLGRPSDGTSTLVELVTGHRSPRSGRVSVAGGRPAHEARVRTRIAALGVEPSLPPGPTVGDCVRDVMRWRGHHADDPLGLLDLGELAPQPVRALTLPQARAVELCLALAHDAAELIVLYEPRCDVLCYDVCRARERLQARAAAGACVLIVTSAPRDAVELGAEQLWVLTAGRFVGAPLAGSAADAAQGELVVWVDSRTAGGVRALATAVGRRDEVVSVRWQRARQAGEPEPLAVGAVDIADAARAIAAEATRLGTSVLSLSAPEPGLAELGYFAVAEQQALAARAAAQASHAVTEAATGGSVGGDEPSGARRARALDEPLAASGGNGSAAADDEEPR